MEFLTVNTDTSSFSPYFPDLCKWGSTSFAYRIIFSYSRKREAKNKTSLLQYDTNQSHNFYFVVLILIIFTEALSVSPAGNIDVSQPSTYYHTSIQLLVKPLHTEPVLHCDNK